MQTGQKYTGSFANPIGDRCPLLQLEVDRRPDQLRRHFEQHGPMNKYQDRFAPGRFRRMPLV